MISTAQLFKLPRFTSCSFLRFSTNSLNTWKKVLNISELPEGGMKGFSLDGKDILLSKQDGNIFATERKCNHYGAPLETGVLHNGVVSCPWHNAKWSVKDGKLVNAPGLRDLQTFPVKVEGDDIFIKLQENKKESANTQFVNDNENRTFLIVGAGPSGTIAAETLRNEGFSGKVIVASSEELVSYDRPLLSKSINVTKEKVQIRTKEWYKKSDIQLKTQTMVENVNPNNGKVVLKDLQNNSLFTINPNSVLVAPGGTARRLNVEGGNLENIFTIRSFSDSQKLSSAFESLKNNNPLVKILVVGSSFIGMEMASSFSSMKECEVVVVGMENVPFERVLGEKFGQIVQKFYEEKVPNLSFKMKRTLLAFKSKPNSNYVGSVLLDDGEVEADIVIVGAGINLSTEFLQRSGFSLNTDKSISVDQYLQFLQRNESDKFNVFAAGDIARYPYLSENIRVEHWAVAQQQGRVAAKNMLGNRIEYNEPPFFWTTSKFSFKYAGHASSFDDAIYQGDTKENKFTVFYSKGDEVKAVLTVGVTGIASAIELFREKRMPSISQIKSNGLINLDKILNE